MKTIIVALAIIGSTLAAQGLPPAASKCMGNVNDATTCSSCYNYGLGTINPRIFVTGSCALPATVTVLVTDCLWYKGTLGAARSATDCGQCNGKAWMNVDTNASPNTIACSDTASSTGDCSTVNDCDQKYCLKTGTSTYVAGCRMCSTGFRGNAGVVGLTAVGFPGCATAGNAIGNCSFYDPMNGGNCYLCAANYAVSTGNNQCTSFVTDLNCRKLGIDTGTLYCGECKNNYFFTTTTCTIGHDTAAAATTTGANLMAVSAAFMALAVFFN